MVCLFRLARLLPSFKTQLRGLQQRSEDQRRADINTIDEFAHGSHLSSSFYHHPQLFPASRATLYSHPHLSHFLSIPSSYPHILSRFHTHNIQWISTSLPSQPQQSLKKSPQQFLSRSEPSFTSATGPKPPYT